VTAREGEPRSVIDGKRRRLSDLNPPSLGIIGKEALTGIASCGDYGVVPAQCAVIRLEVR